MVDLTKGINAAQTVINKTASQIANPKTAQTAEDAASKAAAKLAHELELVDIISKCAEARGRANVPDYIRDIIKRLGR